MAGGGMADGGMVHVGHRVSYAIKFKSSYHMNLYLFRLFYFVLGGGVTSPP